MQNRNKATSGEKITVDGDKEFRQTAGIYLGDEGDLELRLKSMESGESIVFENLSPGMVHPLIAVEVLEDNTTVSEFIALR